MDSESFRIWYKEAQSLTYGLTAIYFPPDTPYKGLRKNLLALSYVLRTTTIYSEDRRLPLRVHVFQLAEFVKYYRNADGDSSIPDSSALDQLGRLHSHLKIGLRSFPDLFSPRTKIIAKSPDQIDPPALNVTTSPQNSAPGDIFTSAAIMIAALSRADDVWGTKPNQGTTGLTMPSPNWERLGRILRYFLKGLTSPCMLFAQLPIYRNYDGETQLEVAWVNVETLISSAFDEMASQGRGT